MKNTFKHGDLVQIDTYDNKVKNANGEYDYFAMVWDKNGDEKSLRLDENSIYQINETNVMPIREIDDGLVLYPLKEANHSHSAKFYIPGDSLIHIGENYPDNEEDEDEEEPYIHEPDVVYADDDDEEDDESDDELDEEPKNEVDELKEFVNISKNITNVIDSLEEVIVSLTKILNNQKR